MMYQMTDEIVDWEKEFTYTSSNVIRIAWNDWDWICKYEIIGKWATEREASEAFEYAKFELLRELK